MTIKILKPGLFTTIQDEGRYGYEDAGFSTSGAMDIFSYQLGTCLLEKDKSPALEMTMIGPTVQFLVPNTFVITGAKFNAKLNGEPVQPQTVTYVSKGDVLEVGAATEGIRGYLNFGKALDATYIADSYATHTRSKIGGFKGRTLQKGDIIPSKNEALNHDLIGRTIDFETILTRTSNVIRVMAGPQFDKFSKESHEMLSRDTYKVTESSDRMGYRLKGNQVPPIESADIISEPVALGSIQVPNDGNPIILMNDKQTVGGYTKIATVIKADLPKVAQIKPGEEIKFEWVTVEEATEVYKGMLQRFSEVKHALKRTPKRDITGIRHTAKKINQVIERDIEL